MRPTIFIAGGGTGGHVFPAVAVAEAMEMVANVAIVFCGTARGVESRVVPARGWALELLDVEPMVGGGPVRAIRGAIVAARAMGHAVQLVRRMRPRAVLSVGGYASGPVSLSAALCGVPVAVLEPNSVVGLANRLLAPVARRAYVAWEEAATSFRPRARRLYGVPLRSGFVPRPSLAKATLRVLVLGGSQGAAALNERMAAAMVRVASASPGWEFDVVHQAGRGHEVEVERTYARAGLERVSVIAFIEDMASAISDADVVVARAGAGTLAEITAVGRASILVPFPHAADAHQRRNGEALARAGAAVCVGQEDADAPRLAAEIVRLLSDGVARAKMAEAARAMGRPDASERVAADFLALAGISEPTDTPIRAAGANGMRSRLSAPEAR